MELDKRQLVELLIEAEERLATLKASKPPSMSREAKELWTAVNHLRDRADKHEGSLTQSVATLSQLVGEVDERLAALESPNGSTNEEGHW